MLQQCLEELTGSGGKALAIPTDVTHFDQVKRLVDAAVQTYGRIDVMINNAGPGRQVAGLGIMADVHGLGSCVRFSLAV